MPFSRSHHNLASCPRGSMWKEVQVLRCLKIYTYCRPVSTIPNDVHSTQVYNEY